MYVKFIPKEMLKRIYNWYLSEEGTEDWLHTLGNGNPPRLDAMAGGQLCIPWESLSVHSEWISWCIIACLLSVGGTGINLSSAKIGRGSNLWKCSRNNLINPYTNSTQITVK